MAEPVVIVRKEHPCSSRECNLPILPKQPAVVSRVKTITVAGEEWKRKYFHPQCREVETGEKIKLPTHQPYLFYTKEE